MLIFLGGKRLEPALPDVAARAITPQVATHVRGHQPVHPAAQLAVLAGPEGQVEDWQGRLARLARTTGKTGKDDWQDWQGTGKDDWQDWQDWQGRLARTTGKDRHCDWQGQALRSNIGIMDVAIGELENAAKRGVRRADPR
jgi:hypothetical protein